MQKQILSIVLVVCLLSACIGCSTPSSENTGDASLTSSVIEDADTEEITDTPIPESENEASPPDSRGIPGMDSFALRYTLQNSPFNMTFSDLIPAPVDARATFAYQAISTGSGNDGVGFDYSITLDSDEEIIGATFGATATTASETQLLQAANLYFSVVSFVDYDTSNEDELSVWIESSLPEISAGNNAAITIGDAVYELYGVPGLTYWLDISKSSP